MKRSPLTRKTPLRRGGFLRRTVRLRAKPKPAMPVSERQAKLDFEATCYGKPCARCGVSVAIIDAHHVLPKQRIKKRWSWLIVEEQGTTVPWRIEVLWKWLWDPRNALPLCRSCHDNHESGYRRIPRRLIPEQAWEFAAELGLTHVLERTYPEEEA